MRDGGDSGADCGIRTHGHLNHNQALYQAELNPPCERIPFYQGAIRGANFRHIPDRFHNSSTLFFTSADISITPGHGRVKPSPGHFFVASTPIFEP